MPEANTAELSALAESNEPLIVAVVGAVPAAPRRKFCPKPPRTFMPAASVNRAYEPPASTIVLRPSAEARVCANGIDAQGEIEVPQVDVSDPPEAFT